jgi:hypothetical protein
MLILHNQVQTEAKAYTHIILVDYQRVSTPKWMQLTAATITIGQKKQELSFQ